MIYKYSGYMQTKFQHIFLYLLNFTCGFVIINLYGLNSAIIKIKFSKNERIFSMKRTLAAILAVSMILSVTACNDSTASGNGDNSGNTTSSATDDGNTEQKLRSNPIAVDADGNIDMDVALKYETDVDALIKKLEAKTPDGSKPVSENTNEETLELFNYLKSVYGKQIIAGQQYSDASQFENIMYYNTTGDMPAIMSFDFLYAQGTDTPDYTQIEEAIKWHNEQNGIVAFCWHWKVPVDMSDKSVKGTAFYSDEIRDFSLEKAVTPGTDEYKVIIKDIDTIALYLQRLETAGVPVIWRPLHEASGAWFWWGVKDRDTYDKQLYQKLWYMLYDRLENYHKLTNLIWVWNGQSKKATVNANTYDIGGMDVYPSSEDHSAQIASYNTLSKYTDDIGKMSALSEVGYIPDPEEVFKADSKVKWLYYAPWCKEFVCASNGSGAVITQLGGTPSVNTERMSEEFLKSVYSSEKVITLSELPDFKGTTKKIPEFIKSWKFNNPKLTIENDKLTAYEQ